MTSVRANGPVRGRGGSAPSSGLAYSTGQVAGFTGASPRTVQRWCDRGELGSYHVGCHTHGGPAQRRVPRDELVRFLRQRHMTGGLALLGEHLSPVLTVLLCGLPDALAVALFHAAGPAVVLKSPLPCLLALGIALAGPFPGGACAVLDASLGRGECLAAGCWLATHAVPVRLVGLCGEDDVKGGDWTLSGFGAVLRHPVRPGDVLAAATGGGG
jgi:excisionase family DNA binding protein